MEKEQELPVEERIIRLLQHLGIKRAHFAARMPTDFTGLASAHPEAVSSLTLVCPPGTGGGALDAVAPRLLVLTGDRGGSAEALRRAATSLTGATLVTLGDYFSPAWADVAADRTDEICSAMMEFLGRLDRTEEDKAPPLPEGEGEVAGITYTIRGSGPPLVLLPLYPAPSQWDPLLPGLSADYCTISLGGTELGAVAALEVRDRAAGFLAMVRSLMEEVRLRPGETVLDVGCGTGFLDRWLADRTGRTNRITGVDISSYLLREAKALARKESLEEVIDFRIESAEALQFADSSFDVTMSVTVMEEVDADKMLAEMVRVTKPGGRVAVIVRALDMSRWINLPLRAELKAKVESPRSGSAGAEEQGCADASLYRRFHAAGLASVRMLPQLVPFDSSATLRLKHYQAQILATLNPKEAGEWEAAVNQAEAEGTLIIAMPFHCAFGTKTS